MARKLSDGSIELGDGRVVYANSLIQAQDLVEILPLVTPPPAWPFVSGGGGGGGGGAGNGASGRRGPQGPAGTGGGGGAQGPQGNQGPQGFQSFQGAVTTAGNSGLQGPASGVQGPQGNQGPQSRGPQGLTGDGGSGAQGSQGLSGSGTSGNQGLLGAQGLTGTAVTGVQGNQGLAGEDGAAGNQGPQGNQGLAGGGGGAGTQGIQGFQGQDGGGGGWNDDGTVVRLTDSTDNVSIGTATEDGKLYVQGDTNELQLQVRGNGTQTVPIVTFEDSTGVDIFNVTAAGTVVPGSDSTRQIGTSSLRWASMAAVEFNVFNVSGDTNPVAQLSRTGVIGRVLFGPGGASALDAGLRRVAASAVSATDGSGTITGSFLPVVDSNGQVGVSDFRYLSMAAVTFNVFNTSGDANPVTQLSNTGAVGRVLFGPGGASALDAGLRRVATSAVSATDGSGTTTGSFRPVVDSAGAVGTSDFRYGDMVAVVFNVFNTAGEANAVVDLSNSGAIGRVRFGPGGATAVDTGLRRVGAAEVSATEGSGTVTGAFQPITDSAGAFGTSDFRYASMVSVAFQVFAASGAANAVVTMDNSVAIGRIRFGPGGATALDTSLRRQAASRISPAEGSSTVTGDFVPLADNAGNVGIEALRWSLVRAVTITPGDMNLESGDGKRAWTLREGTDHIWAINRKNGKKYRIRLREVDHVEERAPEDIPAMSA